MRPEQLRPILLTAGSAVVGTAAWSGHVMALPLAMLFPLLWGLARTRVTAALVSAGYFLAASRGLPQGVATFYASDLWPGLLLWIVASSGFVVVHTVLWTKSERARPFRYLLAAILMAVPPFGITGWAHPVTAAGVLFPGWGWWGLAATIAALVALTTRLWPAVLVASACAWLWSAVTWTMPEVPEDWRGVDLDFGASLGRDTTIARHRELIAKTLAAADGDARIVVLPESALGFWTPTVEGLWKQAFHSRAIVVAGATYLDEGGYDNVLIALSGQGTEVLYRERMPVPGSMWQPWRSFFGSSGGARAHFFGDAVVTLGARRVAPLICYEQLIVWPILQSMLHDPNVIVGVGNGWWSADTSIVEIQRASAKAWARLFDKPLILSFNR